MMDKKEKVTYTTSIDKKIRDEFKIFCVLEGKYQNQVLEEIIEEYLKKEKKNGDGNGDSNK